MNKILVILHIEEQLYYQVYQNGKPTKGVLSKKNGHNIENTVKGILNELKDKTEVGVIIIDKYQEVQKVIQSLSNIELLKKYDSYTGVMKGNNLNNYESWCIIDGLLENVTVYDLNDNQRTISLNKQEAKDNLYNGIIDKTFPSEQPMINQEEKGQFVDEWIQTLKVQKELRGNKTIGHKTEFFNIDYKQAAKWLFGSFIDDIFNKFPDKTFFYFLDEFVNHTILFEQIENKGYKKEFKSKSDSYKFIINGAFHLCKDEADKEIRAIKAKDEECKCYTEPELNELYKGHNIRFFIADAKALKDLYGFKTDNRGAEEAVREEIVKTIGDRLEVDKTTKDKLIASAKKTCISVSFVEAEIEKKCEENIKIFKEKVILDIAIITNRHKKDKSIFTSSKKLKQNILKEVERINTKGLGIDKEKTVQSQLSALDDFYSIYKGNPDAITVDKLPKGIQSIKDGKALIKGIGDEITTRRIAFSILGFVALVIIVFGISQFIPNENDEDSLPTPLPIPTSVQKILNQKTFSKSSLQNTINVLLNLPINDEINRTKIEEHLKNKIGNKSVLILIQHANSNMTSDEKLLFYDFIEEVAADGAGGSLKLINSLTIESVGKTEIIVTEKER
jgi:hypothetical protein